MISWFYDHLWLVIYFLMPIGIYVVLYFLIKIVKLEHRVKNTSNYKSNNYKLEKTILIKKLVIIKNNNELYRFSEDRPEWYEVLQEELNRLPMGKITFNPPDFMRLGIKDRIETRITRDLNTNLLVSLKGRGIPQSEKLKISELMKVRLSGNDFNIITLNEEEQVIEKTGFTEWAWDITPKKSGKKVLYLHVTLRIILPFGEERKDHPVLEKEIIVKVNPSYSIKVFIVSYWKWLVTAFILPLIWIFLKHYINQ